MRTNSILMLALFITTSCEAGYCSHMQADDSIISVKVSREFPFIDNSTGKSAGYELEEIYIFYYKDYVLHKVPYVHNILKISDSGVAEISATEERRSYFVYKKGSTIGFFTDSTRGIYFLESPIDSVLTSYWHMQPLAGRISDEAYYKLKDSLPVNGNSLKLTYEWQSKADTAQKGTLVLNYSTDFPQITFNLSQKFDTINGMKLTAMEIVNNARYIKKYNIHIDEIKQNRELRVLDAYNIVEVNSFFKNKK